MAPHDRRNPCRRYSIMMRTLPALLVCATVLPPAAAGFQSGQPLRTSQAVRKERTSFLFESFSNDDPRPETSFGAEAVPEAQRPVNEFLDVTQQPMFGWANEDRGDSGLLLRLAVTYAVVFGLVCYPISGATFTLEGYEVQKLAAANVGAMLLLLVMLLRIYAGWDYLGNRLTSKVIEYEQTGWFDGALEPKTVAELKRDRFLYKEQVQPVVQRLRAFFAGVGSLCVVSIVGLNWSMQAKPLFNHYDPHVLERLSYDDKLADTAAATTGGQPAYCDSRYYRAIANGGQGCR